MASFGGNQPVSSEDGQLWPMGCVTGSSGCDFVTCSFFNKEEIGGWKLLACASPVATKVFFRKSSMLESVALLILHFKYGHLQGGSYGAVSSQNFFAAWTVQTLWAFLDSQIYKLISNSEALDTFIYFFNLTKEFGILLLEKFYYLCDYILLFVEWRVKMTFFFF